MKFLPTHVILNEERDKKKTKQNGAIRDEEKSAREKLIDRIERRRRSSYAWTARHDLEKPVWSIAKRIFLEEKRIRT